LYPNLPSALCPVAHGNNYASLPTGHSVHLKESYKNLELILTKIGYTVNDWMICGDLKVVCMLLGQEAGYTKYPCCMYSDIGEMACDRETLSSVLDSAPQKPINLGKIFKKVFNN
jgi:hypothetical protein